MNERLFYGMHVSKSALEARKGGSPDENSNVSAIRARFLLKSGAVEKPESAVVGLDEEGRDTLENTQSTVVLPGEDLDNLVCFPFFVYADAERGWEIMRYTDHVYPLFAIIQSTILARGVEDGGNLMSQETLRGMQGWERMQTMKEDNAMRLSRELEASFSERLEMVSKLSETVLKFMLCFREKFFESFLQILYDSYNVTPAMLLAQRVVIDEQGSADFSSSRFSSRSSAKPKKISTSVYVYDEEEELIIEE